MHWFGGKKKPVYLLISPLAHCVRARHNGVAYCFTIILFRSGNPARSPGPVARTVLGGQFMSRIALVTGGTRGIGAAISLALQAAGRQVIANYGGNDAAAQAFTAETGIPSVRFDVGDFAACEESIRAIEAKYGVIEVLVNNAGITRDATLSRMTRSMWDDVVDTNLGSCYNTCKLTFDGMKSRKFGRVVNVGSINGQAGQYGQVNYAAAKSGIHGFTKALAQEGARFGITCNAIAPGYVDTDMVRAVPDDVLQKIIAKIPVGRLGHASDIARGVAFLTADDADFVTGSTLSINGGQHMY
jgi:acetoacetyl-CoA reductase